MCSVEHFRADYFFANVQMTSRSSVLHKLGLFYFIQCHIHIVIRDTNMQTDAGAHIQKSHTHTQTRTHAHTHTHTHTHKHSPSMYSGSTHSPV